MPRRVGLKEVQRPDIRGVREKHLLWSSEVQGNFQTEGLADFQSAAEIGD